MVGEKDAAAEAAGGRRARDGDRRGAVDPRARIATRSRPTTSSPSPSLPKLAPRTSTGSGTSQPPGFDRQGRFDRRQPADLYHRARRDRRGDADDDMESVLQDAHAADRVRAVPTAANSSTRISRSSATVLKGTPENQPRWKRGVKVVESRSARPRPALRRAVFSAREQGADGRARRRTCSRPTGSASTASTG